MKKWGLLLRKPKKNVARKCLSWHYTEQNGTKMKQLTYGRKYKPKTMEKRGIVHIDDVMEYLDDLKSWDVKNLREKSIMILLYVHKKFDISKEEALECLYKWVRDNDIDLKVKS